MSESVEDFMFRLALYRDVKRAAAFLAERLEANPHERFWIVGHKPQLRLETAQMRLFPTPATALQTNKEKASSGFSEPLS